MDPLLRQAEAARREGNPLALYDLAQSAIAAGHDAPRLRYLQVLALAQMGDTAQAEHLYDGFGLGRWDGDEDALALRGRLHKDRALGLAGAARVQAFRAASEAYLRAYQVRRGYFPGVNAGTTTWAAGDHGAARRLARQVLVHPDLNPPGDFYAAASRAEALVLLGRAEEAGQTLARAVASGPVGQGERASAFRQLDWLCASAHLSDVDRQALLATIRPAPVITYTGHMFRSGNPAEDRLAAQIRCELQSTGAAVAYGPLACGSDILVAEAILERGGELHAVLPFVVADFIEASVRPGGEDWIDRFHACIERAASVTLATRANYAGDDGQFSYGAQFAMGLALLRAAQLATAALQLAVWDGRPGHGGTGTAVEVATWRALGRETCIIAPGSIDRGLAQPVRLPPVHTSTRAVRAIIFSDYQGYSTFGESEMAAFNHEILGRVATVLDRHGAGVCARNTWGDAFFAIITEPAEAAEIVLEIIDLIGPVRIGAPGKAEGMRIGLHYGPVFQEVDPVTGRDNFYGSEVTLTARIEPTAIPGQIYTTQAFAAMLAASEPDRFVTRYVGRVELAKGHGAAPIYRLERRRGAEQQT